MSHLGEWRSARFRTVVLIAQTRSDAMDVMEAIYQRRSRRASTDQPVDKATVEALLPDLRDSG